MTSTTNQHLHHQQRQKSQLKLPPKMTNTNDEHANQNNQQELIRLLAQHFNNQLTNRAATISGSQPPPLPTVPSGASISNFQATLAHYQQQQHQQYRAGQDAINFSTQNRALNLEQRTSPTYLPIRSQPSTMVSMTSAGSNNQIVPPGPGSRGAPIGQQHLTGCNPFMSDMNLFNALNCFGLPNDQFVLSLQQQYLMQAATAARQLELRMNRGDSNNTNLTFEHHSAYDSNRDQQQQQQQLVNKCMNNTNLTELGSEMTPNRSGRELLKFSINTILGRGSPLPTGEPTIDDLRQRTGSPPLNRYFNNQNVLIVNSKLNDGNNESRASNEQPISPECDPDIMTDIDSESSSTPAPNGQSNAGLAMNSPRLSNQPEHHRSASSSANDQQGLISNVVAGNNDLQHSARNQQLPSLSFLANSTAFPWTVASRGKPRRGMMRRAVFSDSQRVGLEKRFQLQKYISKPDRKKLAEKLGLRDSQVKIWFQNRRMKWRNSKERELLSAGGSREQTLPTRNNPNPDLSDVGETFKRLVSGSNNIGTV